MLTPFLNEIISEFVARSKGTRRCRRDRCIPFIFRKKHWATCHRRGHAPRARAKARGRNARVVPVEWPGLPGLIFTKKGALWATRRKSSRRGSSCPPAHGLFGSRHATFCKSYGQATKGKTLPNTRSCWP